jgi:N-acetylmuramoyl-L-alanine amidase
MKDVFRPSPNFPSPNFDARPQGQAIDLVILHYTGMADGPAALTRLCDPAAGVSAHYLIDEAGEIFRLVDEAARAWHAGVACWQDASDINARSIGIELVNPGHEFGYRKFALPQMAALEKLLPEILARHGIASARVLGHSDVAPLRKSDPGELFDWAGLARLGVGLWPDEGFKPDLAASALKPGERGPRIALLQQGLQSIGYCLGEVGVDAGVFDGFYDVGLEAVVRAFQRHFRQQLVDGIGDAETASLISHLARRAA